MATLGGILQRLCLMVAELSTEIFIKLCKKKNLRRNALIHTGNIVIKYSRSRNIHSFSESLLTIYITVLVTRGRHFGARESV
jgi:hypothetical protein